MPNLPYITYLPYPTIPYPTLPFLGTLYMLPTLYNLPTLPTYPPTLPYLTLSYFTYVRMYLPTRLPHLPSVSNQSILVIYLCTNYALFCPFIQFSNSIQFNSMKLFLFIC
jgi:hypothetical protein